MLTRDYVEVAQTIFYAKKCNTLPENDQAKLALANSITQNSTNLSQTHKNPAEIGC
jgi:hypothetical protein